MNLFNPCCCFANSTSRIDSDDYIQTQQQENIKTFVVRLDASQIKKKPLYTSTATNTDDGMDTFVSYIDARDHVKHITENCNTERISTKSDTKYCKDPHTFVVHVDARGNEKLYKRSKQEGGIHKEKNKTSRNSIGGKIQTKRRNTDLSQKKENTVNADGEKISKENVTCVFN